MLKEKEIKQYGEYRTRRLVLEAWDRMAAVDFDVEAYKPMVDPPPAHPSVAHPNRDGSVYEGPGFAPMVEPATSSKSSGAQSSVEESPQKYEETTTVELKPEEHSSNEQSTQSSDYSLYKCQGCDQMVIGFDQESHVRTVHGGESPGFGRL